MVLLGQNAGSGPSAPAPAPAPAPTPSAPAPSSPAPAPSGGAGITRYLSSIPPGYVFNSWGLLNVNTSVLGLPINLNGVTYQNGLGVNAYSELHWPLYGNCSSMTATVGVDDEIPGGVGNLAFQVWADGHKLYDSGNMQGGSPAQTFTVNLTGYQNLGLVVTNGIYQAPAWQVPADNGDWANATITCAN
jgi:alpha-galactosidase